MSTFEYGDRVKITTGNSAHTGKEGVVINAYGPEKTVLVQFDDGYSTGFFNHEVELSQKHDEVQQIRAIATALFESGRYDTIPWVEIKEDAASLYRAGVRFDG